MHSLPMFKKHVSTVDLQRYGHARLEKEAEKG